MRQILRPGTCVEHEDDYPKNSSRANYVLGVYFCQQTRQSIGTYIIPILQMKKLRLRVAK